MAAVKSNSTIWKNETYMEEQVPWR